MNFTSLGFIKVAAATPDVVLGDPLANAAAVVACAQTLAQDNVSIAVFPELCITGYSAEDLFFTDALLRDASLALGQICAANPLPLVAVGLPWRLDDGRMLNCAAVISHNKLLGMVPKSVQPNYGEFYDLRWFVPGARINESVLHKTLGAFQIRCDQLFDMDGHRVGVEIC
jgi:NAD+ synthase (glutamine-hydrolysing)